MQAQSLNLDESVDPDGMFDQWMAEAEASEPNDPNAMSLASVDGDGMPDVRIVLMKAHDGAGFTFYTNFESAKGRQLQASGMAALAFHWKSLRRQVRVRGRLEEVSAAEADSYFATRHPTSRRGAIASEQSRPLASRAVLEARLREVEARFPDDDAIPRPAHWSGFRLVPRAIEFWQDGANRLHDRFRFERAAPGDRWTVTRLYP